MNIIVASSTPSTLLVLRFPYPILRSRPANPRMAKAHPLTYLKKQVRSRLGMMVRSREVRDKSYDGRTFAYSL